MPALPLPISPLIDEILPAHREWAGAKDDGAWAGYRNHAQRVFLFASHLARLHADAQEKVAIAAAFHDLAVFRTMDYLEPSLDALEWWLRDYGRPEWGREIGLAVSMHHRVRPWRGEGAWLVEAVRRADWAEVSGGLLHHGIPRDLVRRAQRELPIGPFMARVLAKGTVHALTHPADPLPFFHSARAAAKARSVEE